MSRDEFESTRGELQRHGDPNVLGLGKPLPPDIPIGVAPGYPRHVYSIFDSRPIGGYDFAISVVREMDGSAAAGTVTDFTYQAPPGYVSFLKRVDIEFWPGFTSLPASSAAATFGFFFDILRDSVAVPNTRWQILGEFGEIRFDTAHVFQPLQVIGLRAIRGQNTFVGFAEGVDVVARFHGTLILDTGEPAIEQVGSDESRVIRRLIDGFVQSRFGLLVPQKMKGQP